MTIDVSVIITAFNVEQYITRAIESALQQQDVNIEVIVVDDRSTDNTWNIVRQINDPRVKPIQLEVNGGPSVARNAAIAMASGKWIAILDGDDAFEPSRLKTLLKHENADIIVDNLNVCKESDGSQFIMFPKEDFAALSPLTVADFIKGTLHTDHNYTLGYLKPLFLKAFLDKHTLKYDTKLRIGEDYNLLLEALLNGARCAIEPSAGYLYTARVGSISYRLPLSQIISMIEADKKILSRYTLSDKAATAQANRTKQLKKEYGYTRIIDALKQKDWSGVLKAVASHPSSVWLLRRPLEVRIQRILAKT